MTRVVRLPPAPDRDRARADRRSSRTCACSASSPDLGLVATVAIAYQEGPEVGRDLRLRRRPEHGPLPADAARALRAAYALTGYCIGILQGGLLRSAWWVPPVLGALGGILGGLLFIGIGALVGQEQLFALRSLRLVLLVGPLRRHRGADHLPDCRFCGPGRRPADNERDEQARMVTHMADPALLEIR